jgi:hypothetical protein
MKLIYKSERVVEMIPKKDYERCFCVGYSRNYWYDIYCHEDTLVVCIGPKEFYSESETLDVDEVDAIYEWKTYHFTIVHEICRRLLSVEMETDYNRRQSEIIYRANVKNCCKKALLDACYEIDESLLAAIYASQDEKYESGKDRFMLMPAEPIAGSSPETIPDLF